MEAQTDSRSDDAPRGAPFRQTLSVEPGGTVYVDLESGSVRVEGHAEPTVVIEARSEGWAAESARFSVASQGRDVCLDGSLDPWLPGVIGGARVRVRMRIPRSSSVDVHTGGGSVRVRDVAGRCAIDTGGGAIHVRDLGGSLLAESGGGSLELVRVRGEARVRTAGGTIDVEDPGGEVSARTLGGNVSIRGAGARIDAKTLAGSIAASFRSTRPEGELSTSAGRVQLAILRDAAFSLDARTSVGRITLSPDLATHPSAPPSPSELKTSVAPDRTEPPTNQITLRTNAGPIHITTTPD